MLINLLFFAFTTWADTEKPLLEAGSHCVVYNVHKVMFLVSSGTVIGKNCEVSAQVLPEVGGQFHVEVTIPIRNFKSGDSDRDESVAKTLKDDVQAELTFHSKAMTAEDWRALFAKSNFNISGELSVGQKTYPVTFASHYIENGDNAEVEGVAKVKFSDFEISPPKVVGGVVAKTKPDFELYFHLLGSRILGAESIRLSKK